MMRVIVAWIVGLGLAANGLTMLAFPDAWYDLVPGVPQTGPFNPHFVRDIGAAYLVAGATLVWLCVQRRLVCSAGDKPAGRRGGARTRPSTAR